MTESSASAGIELGKRLRRARDKAKLPLSAVASAAEISIAYLQKLEAGGVKQPSPKILYKLAQNLEVDYAELMLLARYALPSGTDEPARPRYALVNGLGSDELTASEAKELAHYLDWIRYRANHD